MKCPRDQTILEERREREVLVHQCPQCHGIWMAKQHFNPLLHEATIPAALTSREPAAEHAAADCPVGPDAHRLQHRVVRGVPIDFCERHPGFWLDGGELELLRQRVIQGKQARSVGARRNSTDAAGAAGWFVFEGVLEILVNILSGL